MNPAAEGYRGLWRRRLLRAAGGEDRHTRVWWLQGDAYYVDLRQPPQRPDFNGVTGFEQCDAGQLAWLASQQGFAGRLEIHGNRLHWQRRIDLQPPAAVADIGTVHWDGECLHEQGVLADYAEEWLWQRPTTALSRAWATADGRGLRVAVGDWFMQALERRRLPQRGAAGAAPILPGCEARELLDCAIDFGLVTGGARPWQILHSSLPWREGEFLSEPGPPWRSPPPP